MIRWLSDNGRDLLFWACVLMVVGFVLAALLGPWLDGRAVVPAIIAGAVAGCIYLGEEPEDE
jgi:hypothetical protein